MIANNETPLLHGSDGKLPTSLAPLETPARLPLGLRKPLEILVLIPGAFC